MCSIPKTPVFTLKGLCGRGTSFHWNYYLSVNSTHQIDLFESYKRDQFIRLKDDVWESQLDGDIIQLQDPISPVGRKEWSWYEQSCNSKQLDKRNLTFSFCDFGSEFTCSTGHCIDMRKRCNSVKDCIDESDEEQCSQLEIPKTYEKINPPEEKVDSEESLVLQTQITIENIKHIDTKNMVIGLTLNIRMRWKDLRLVFKNLSPGKKNLVSHNVLDKIWMSK